MHTVDDFAAIRRAHRDGLSIREIARKLGVGRDTVRKALHHPEPPPYTLDRPRPAPAFGPFREVVDAILDADEQAPPKQRHTASRLFRRLRDEYGYQGGYDQVRRHLKTRRLDRRETFIPLDHPPGCRAEADFGHIHADFPDGRRLVPVLLVTWSYSNRPFAVALPTERTEAVLHGLVEAFAFFGCVPRELWWDNPRTVAVHLLRGRDRTLHPRYAALASHYTFAPKFCLPARGNQKPRVEHRVFDLQRRWATPVPRVAGLDELNSHLLGCCLGERAAVSGDHTETVGVRFDRDWAASLPTPGRRFDACILQIAQVDKYQTVRFDHNVYSVPRRWAFRAVTVKGYVDHVEVVADGQVVARHAAATAGANASSTRCTSSWCWDASRRRWTTPRSTATGSCRRRSPTCAATWRPGSARASAAGTSSAFCNCWPITRWPGSSRRSCSAAAAARRTPPRSPAGWNGWPSPTPGPAAWDRRLVTLACHRTPPRSTVFACRPRT